MKKSKSQMRLDSGSPDELARSALLDDTSHQLMRASTQDSTLDAISPRSPSGKSGTDIVDKPLPPIPAQEAMGDSMPQKQAKTALASKTTNAKVLRKGERQGPKREISAPVVSHVPQIDMVRTATSINQSTQDPNQADVPQTTTADAAELSKKLTDLMQESASKDSKKRLRRKVTVKGNVSTAFKPSPLQRSKTAFAKATRAITGRLSNSSEKLVISDQKGNTFLDSNLDLPHPEMGFLPPLSRGRLERRIAEGENLGNPKIQDLMGQGNIPRKPLPVYESMTASKRQSDLMEDPFSDGDRPETPVDLDVGLDIDFSRHKNKRTSKHEGFPFRNPPHTTSTYNFEPLLSAADGPSRFSDKISGLAQHADVMDFSSSPIGYSTPRIRLEPRPDADGKKRLTGVLVRSPSVLDFSFEDYQTEDDEPMTPDDGSQATTDYDRSLSVKRKKAKDNLRARMSPSNKKAKRVSDASMEGSLVLDAKQFDTEDYRLLSKRQSSIMAARPNPETRNVKGMSMSDTNDTGKPLFGGLGSRSQSLVGIRPPSSSRPTSILFSRETRAHSRQLSIVEGESMDIDELQADH